ncbi:MAG: alkaline phosphatase family protein [Saprospiraceae bacterium]|nr:alkaline phosphatase family protein [Saprospiraceae bacterium]
MTRQKVLLLGWDSADWKTIHPLVDQGLMPNMQKLIEGGTIGNLATLDPMYSPMLWSSIATGKRPYKHGVLGFTEVTPDGTNIRPVMSVSRKCKAIWNILTQNNIKNHVGGWRPSHPAEHINGTMISNFYQKAVGKIHEPWPLASGTVHPESESDFFATLRVHPGEITGEHILPFVPQAGKINQFKDKRLAGIAKITSDASSLHAAFTNIIRTKEWDFAALYLDAIDHYCHGFMKYNPPKRSHISQEDYDVYNNVVTAGYRFHDMMLGRIMELIDDQTILMLISDHGFQPGHLRPRNIPNEPAGPAYEHSRYGIFAAMGPGIKKDSFTFGASLLDITPTILQIMGLAIGEDMDGRVLNNIFEKTQAPNYIPSWKNIEGDRMISESHISVKENTGEEALKQLEDLGYIEKQTSDLPTRIKQTRNECQFNLARAYIDGGLISDAVPILED